MALLIRPNERTNAKQQRPSASSDADGFCVHIVCAFELHTNDTIHAREKRIAQRTIRPPQPSPTHQLLCIAAASADYACRVGERLRQQHTALLLCRERNGAAQKNCMRTQSKRRSCRQTIASLMAYIHTHTHTTECRSDAPFRCHIRCHPCVVIVFGHSSTRLASILEAGGGRLTGGNESSSS